MGKRLAALGVVIIIVSAVAFFIWEDGIRAIEDEIRQDEKMDLENFRRDWLEGSRNIPDSLKPPEGYSSVYQYIIDSYRTKTNEIKFHQRLQSISIIGLAVGGILLGAMALHASFKL